MKEGSLHHKIGRDIEESLNHTSLPEAGNKPLRPDDFEFPEGTDPSIETSKMAKKNDRGLREEVSSILQGLHEASVQIKNEKPLAEAEARKAAAAKKVLDAKHADEEREWEGAIKLAKQKIADTEEALAKSAPKGKGVDLREKIKTTLAADEAARKQADDDRWEAAELTARKRIGEEEQGWEDKELEVRKKLGLEAHAQDEKRNKNKLSIANLMKRLGFGKKESR